MITETATGSKPAPSRPLDDAGYRYLSARARSRLVVLPGVSVRNPPEYSCRWPDAMEGLPPSARRGPKDDRVSHTIRSAPVLASVSAPACPCWKRK